MIGDYPEPAVSREKRPFKPSREHVPRARELGTVRSSTRLEHGVLPNFSCSRESKSGGHRSALRREEEKITPFNPKPVSKRVHLTLPDDLYAKIESWADYEARPVANLALFLIQKAIEEAEKNGTLPDHRKQK